MRIIPDVKAVLAGILTFAALAVAGFIFMLLASRADAALIGLPGIALGVLAPIASGGLCGYLARRHDLIAVLTVGAVDTAGFLGLAMIGDFLKIPRDHYGVSLDIIGVTMFVVPLVVVAGALGGKLRSGRNA